MTNLVLLLKSSLAIISFTITLIVPLVGNASETCIETYQVDCEHVDTPSTNAPINQFSPTTPTNMHALFYSGGILNNQVAPASNAGVQIDQKQALLNTHEAADSIVQQDNNMIEVAVDNLNLILLRENFYDHSDKNRRTTQKCLRNYGYDGKIDGVWGDKTYFALLSYQDAHIGLEESSFFNGIKKIVANFRNCDEVLDQILE